MDAILRKQEEIDEVLNWAAEGANEKSHFPGLSYEEGIIALYEWLTDWDVPRPDED